MTFEDFVNKMLSDQKFRHEVKINPKAALEQAGMKPTREQIETLKSVNYQSLQNVAHAFGESTMVT